jgi:hypothetical protein
MAYVNLRGSFEHVENLKCVVVNKMTNGEGPKVIICLFFSASQQSVYGIRVHKHLFRRA